MRYLGIDFGAKRIGLAVSSEYIAFPHSVVTNDSNALSVIAALVEKEKIGCVVVGDARSFGDIKNPVTESADRFAEELGKKISAPIERAFEVNSSIEASRYAEKGDEHNDAAAAAVILQRYLDMRPRDTL